MRSHRHCWTLSKEDMEIHVCIKRDRVAAMTIVNPWGGVTEVPEDKVNDPAWFNDLLASADWIELVDKARQ